MNVDLSCPLPRVTFMCALLDQIIWLSLTAYRIAPFYKSSGGPGNQSQNSLFSFGSCKILIFSRITAFSISNAKGLEIVRGGRF